MLSADKFGSSPVRNAQGGKLQHQPPDVSLHAGGGKGSYESSLAATHEHYVVLVYVGALLEVAHNGLQRLLLVEHRHVDGVVVRAASRTATGEVEGEAHIPYLAEHLEIAAPVVMGAVEAMRVDDDGVAPPAVDGSAQHAIDVFAAMLDAQLLLHRGAAACSALLLLRQHHGAYHARTEQRRVLAEELERHDGFATP